MLRLVATVDLSTREGDVEHGDRTRLADLDGLPTGALVRVTVGSRAWPSVAAVVALRAHQDRLTIQLEGEVHALRNWYSEVAAPVVGGGGR